MQDSLFDNPNTAETIRLFHAGNVCGELQYYADAFRQHSDAWLSQLLQQTPWQQDQIRMAGKSIDVPRLQCWYGESAAYYQYSGIHLSPQPWTPLLQTIKQQVEDMCGLHFNSALINCYRDGQDSVSWHADDEPELGDDPLIASLSLGHLRPFCLRSKNNLKKVSDITPPYKGVKYSHYKMPLTHGSLLVMGAGVQKHWLHSIPKQQGIDTPRINITFRKIIL